MEDSSSSRMSYLDRRLNDKPSHIHIDPTSVVINIHLTTGHEDTGTSFWRPSQGGRGHAKEGSPYVVIIFSLKILTPYGTVKID